MAEPIRGVVKGNVVIPEKGAALPEGVTVEIWVIPKASKRAWEPFIGLWAEQPEWIASSRRFTGLGRLSWSRPPYEMPAGYGPLRCAQRVR